MTENYTGIVLPKQLLLLVLSVLNTVLGQGNTSYVMQGCMICDISWHFSSLPSLVGVSDVDASQFPGNSCKNSGHITTDCCCLIDQWTTFDWLDLQNFPYKAHIYIVLVVLIIEFLLHFWLIPLIHQRTCRLPHQNVIFSMLIWYTSMLFFTSFSPKDAAIVPILGCMLSLDYFVRSFCHSVISSFRWRVNGSSQSDPFGQNS